MNYTVGEMAARIGVAPSTLRYWEKEGLLPFVARTESGIRQFQESDYECLRIIGCLKETGMSIKDIRTFIALVMEGDSTMEARRKLFERQKELVEEQIAALEHTRQVLDFKCWYYETAERLGSTQAVAELTDEEMPAEMAAIRSELRGEHEEKAENRKVI